MYWGDLSFIVAVHRNGTYSAAAKAMGVTHTTVARRIRELERRYGAQLVDSTRQGALLTPAGETVLETALRIEDQLGDLERQVKGKDSKLAGPVRLTTCDAFAWFYAERFRAFGDRYPEIELEIIADSKVRDLARREADIAIRVTDDPPENLVGRRLDTLEQAIYGARSLIEGTEDQRSLPWITYTPIQPPRKLEAWMQARQPAPKIAAQVDNALIMLRAAQAGIGLAVLPTSLGDGDSNLLRLGQAIPELREDVWLLTTRESLATARVRALYGHMAGR